MTVCKEYINIRWTDVRPKTEFIGFMQSTETAEVGVYMLVKNDKVSEVKKIIKILNKGK